MDRTDLRILEELLRNGRISMAELAERVNLSATPCIRRVKKLEQEGVINGYTAKVDLARIGLEVEALTLVKLTVSSTDNSDAFEKLIADLPEVRECCVITGGHDYLLRVTTRSLTAYEEFLRTHLRGARMPMEIESMIVLKSIATNRSAFVNAPGMI